MHLPNPVSVNEVIVDPVPSRCAPSVALSARPEPIRLDAATTVVIVVDMQNAYASKGGYVDEAGWCCFSNLGREPINYGDQDQRAGSAIVQPT